MQVANLSFGRGLGVVIDGDFGIDVLVGVER
jgi:hypothetical protein